MRSPERAQAGVRWRSSLSAFIASEIGHAETATIMAKSSASIANSRVLSLAKHRARSRIDRRIADFCTLARLNIVLFTVITFIAAHWISHVRAESGYEVLKAHDDSVTGN